MFHRGGHFYRRFYYIGSDSSVYFYDETIDDADPALAAMDPNALATCPKDSDDCQGLDQSYNALAAQATLGGVSVSLPTPSGFCDLSPSEPSDQRMIQTLADLLVASGNELLGMSADCRQLSDWHSGNRQLLDDYGQYQTPIASMDKPPSETVAQTCAMLRQQGNQILANELPDIKARVESTVSNIAMNETKFIGVVGENPNACYAGLIQKIQTEAGTDKTQVTLFAITIVKDRSLFVYRFSVYQNPHTVEVVLGKIKIDVAALMAANR